jgi:O-acetyl-ADP-ribose deacetylase (regulator of RNase III)
MFTTEFKLKPKPNLKLFVIQYNLKNLSKVMPLIELNEYKRRIAIVNAANPQIQNGTGVTGAISYGLNSYTKGKDVYEAYKKVRKYYKVYDEHNIFEEEEKYPNPYIDRTAVINDMKIAYDDIKMYYYNHCSAFDPYPKYDYLIHVAGPNISGMNYTNEYMRLIGGTTQLESWKIILKRTLETLMNCVQYLKITDLYLPLSKI